ncbi:MULTISPECIES: acyltransferase family protein [unclassified Rhizobium]|uniref:acyltransferase family protein n=1 Tax=unclassified Rhizobium TaxID=2613769 RepID=UPI002479CEF1|nr:MULTISPECIES: acyltransferase family protein [unclassified Rhizobium]MDH7801275.1 peptidoglycan/LPS O-acetylase OafA/YrhL [Rhizobium sp. AN70]
MFFVLSGLVLPMSFFRSGGDNGVISVGVLSRFPRLLFLVFVTVMGSYLLSSWGLMYATEASQVGGSTWLGLYGQPQESEHFQITFYTALWQGLFGTLLENRSEYNSSLWTMHHELYGSFVTFGLAMLLFRAPLRVVVIISAFAYVALQATAWRLAPFVVGTGLSAFFYSRPQFSLKLPASLLCIGVGFIFYSYNHHEESRWPNAFIPWGNDEQKAWVVSTLAGVCFIIGVVGNPVLRNLMNARWLTALGRYSFAMYAVHMLLVGSLASFIFANVAPDWGVVLALMVTTAAFIPALAMFSYFLTRADEWWVRHLQRAVRKILSPRSSVVATHPLPRVDGSYP